MTSTIYILIMLWAGASHNSGMTVLQQEFNSLEACEIARKHLEKSHRSVDGTYNNSDGRITVRTQGCFKK